MPEARHVEQHGLDNFTYGMFVLVEEVMEMAGVWVFLSGIVKYFSQHVSVVEFAVETGGGTDLRAAPGAFLDRERPAV